MSNPITVSHQLYMQLKESGLFDQSHPTELELEAAGRAWAEHFKSNPNLIYRQVAGSFHDARRLGKLASKLTAELEDRIEIIGYIQRLLTTEDPTAAIERIKEYLDKHLNLSPEERTQWRKDYLEADIARDPDWHRRYPWVTSPVHDLLRARHTSRLDARAEAVAKYGELDEEAGQ